MKDLKNKILEVIKKLEPLIEKASIISPKKLFSIMGVAVLTISLPTTLVLLNQSQDLQQSASELTTIHHLSFSPGQIISANDGKPVRLSVLAYNGLNQPISENVIYQWGISSTNSIGTLTEVSGSIASFIPQNIGVGDIYVTATSFDNQITQSIPVSVSVDGNPIVITPMPTNGISITPAPTTGPTSTPEPNGFKAEYYPSTDFKGTPTIVKEKAINHNWGSKAPLPNFRADGFSVRWTISEKFEKGSYEFTARSDDGMRVFIDGKRYYNAWKQGLSSGKFIVNLSEGYHNITVEYFEYKGNALAQFSWKEYQKSGKDDDSEKNNNRFPFFRR